jgi:hypothetical protein
MFETAVIGLIGPGRISDCMSCHAAAGREGFACTGFGAGCFLPRREAAPEPARALIRQDNPKR